MAAGKLEGRRHLVEPKEIAGPAGLMSGRSRPLYRTLFLLITMHSHQSYHNITTVIHSYEYSTTVDNSTIETYRNRGLAK